MAVCRRIQFRIIHDLCKPSDGQNQDKKQRFESDSLSEKDNQNTENMPVEILKRVC